MERGHQIATTNTVYFRHDYDCEHADMRRLYEQAKIDQWNAATDIDWSRPLEGDAGLVRNMRKVGVLTNRVAPDLEALGISLAAA